MHQAGEFRDIVSVFVSLRESANAAEINQLIQRTVEETQRFGGYFNRVSFGDKGGVMPIFFGMPQSYENNLVRALDFALELQKLFPERIRIGLNSGIAYAGFIGSSLMSEYTAYGDIVNQSARFMANAGWGKIWLSEKAAKQSSGFYRFTDLGNMSFKGKSRPIAVYELTNKADNSETAFFDGQIIGRKSELALLNDFANPLSAGMFAGIVTVYADAGIGKSRLVYEFTRSMHTAEVLFLQTDSVLKMSLNPFKYLLHNYFNQKVADKEDKKSNFEAIYNLLLQILSNSPDSRKTDIIKELERTKSILAAQLEIYYENSLYEQLDAKTRFENTLYAYKEFFKALALFKPVIIQIEDIHWLDEDSHKLAQTLCRAVEDFPLLIIATSRLNDDGSKPAFIVNSEVPQRQLMLEKLDQDSAAELIRMQLGGAAEANLLNFISQKGEFNPFFIEQTILYLKESSLLCIKDKCYSLSSDQITIPDGISALIIARIDRLAGELKEIVQLASIFGREVELKVFLLMIELYQSNLNINQVGELLVKIENEQLWHKFAEIKYIFKHALLNEAAYEMQLKSRLRELHRLAAQSMEKIHFNEEDKYYEIAHHYDKAEEIELAVKYYGKAGDYLKKSYQNEKAIVCYNKVLEHLDESNDTISIIDVTYNKGMILELIGAWAEAGTQFQKALELSQKNGNHKLVEISINLAWLKSDQGDKDTAIDIYNRAIALIEKGADLHGRAILTGNLGVVYWNIGEYKNAMECYQEYLTSSKNNGDERGVGVVNANLGNLYIDLGEYDNAMECYKTQLAMAQKIDDKYLISVATGNIGRVFYARADYTSAMEYYIKRLQMVVELGDKHGISSATGNLGNIHYFQQNLLKAMDCYQKQLQIAVELGAKQMEAHAIGNIGNVLLDQGKFGEAVIYYQKGLQLNVELRNKTGESVASGNLGLLYLGMGDYTQAINCLNTKLRIATELNDKRGISIATGNLGLAYRALKDNDRALTLLNSAIEKCKEIQNRHYCCEYLNESASLLFDLKEYSKVGTLNLEANQIATEIGRDDILFQSAVLSNKLTALDDSAKAVVQLTKMLETETENRNLARIHHEIYKINRSAEHGLKALQIYQTLYSSVPNIMYKKAIDELSV